MNINSSSDQSEYDAVFYEAFEEEQLLLQRFLPAGYRYLFSWKTIQESAHTVPPAPVISTRTQSQFPDSWISSLNAIITRSTGYDHVIEYFCRTGTRIQAAYLPDYAARAVAEQAMILWSSLLRNLNQQQQAFRTFFRDGLTGREIRSRTIAILGVGRIGSEIVDIASGLSMQVIGVDLTPDPGLSEKYHFQYASMTEAVGRADIVVCSMNLTEENRGLLDYELLGRIPKGGIFVNIARGEISPVKDLVRLLNKKHLAGVALDVYDYEKGLANVLRGGIATTDLDEDAQQSINAILDLQKIPNVILTPHNAFNTVESVERKSRHTAENFAAYMTTGAFITPVP